MSYPLNSRFGTKSIFYLLCFTLLILMAFMSLDSGISGDEYFEEDQAEYIFNFYNTLGKDTTAINPPYTLEKYYGQSFSTLAYTINKLFNINSFYESRHLLNSISGWILILFSGLTANLLFGWRSGIITILFIFFSPKILGHSWNNPKDIPFAMTYTLTIYFIFKFIRDLPNIKKRNIFFLIIGIAGAISIRIGGLIIIPYLFLFTGIYYITKKEFYSVKEFVKATKVIGILLSISIVGYFVGLLLWPFGIKDPINNPLEALKEMINYEVGLNQLFEGKIQLSKELPWFYGLKYILISSPIIIFIGLLIFIITIPFREDKKNNYKFYSFLLFAFAFPIAYTIYKHSNLYGGWRHLLWTYSPIVILSAGGFEYLLNKSNKYIKYGTLSIILVLLWHPVKHTFKNHPHQYVYYNQLVGGVNGAYGKYEMDYYYHSLKAGADWLIENELTSDSITVATNHSRIVEYYFRNYPNVKVKYSRFYEKGKSEWDYAIWANTHVTPIQLEQGYWPPQKAIYTVDVDNVPIGAVVKRVSDKDFKGFEALKKNKTADAKKHFKEFLKLYPENEEVLEGYSRALLTERKPDSTIIYADSSLLYNPRQIGALFLKASALNVKKEYNKVIPVCEEMFLIKESFPEAHYQKGLALKSLNKPNEALKEFQLATSYKKEYYGAFMQIGEIFINYKKYNDAIEKIYKKALDFRKDDLLANANIAKCYHFLKDNENAEIYLKQASQKGPRNFNVIKTGCRIELDKGNLNGAVQLLNMARNINTDSELFVIRALYTFTQDKNALAKQYLDKAVELDNSNREALELLKRFKVSKASTTQKSVSSQKSIMYQKETKKKPINPLQPRKR